MPLGGSSKNTKLPGSGGIFNTINLSLYSYAGLNPVGYVDPDGRFYISSHKVVGAKETTHSLTFQQQNTLTAIMGFIPGFSTVIAMYDMEQTSKSTNASSDVRSAAEIGLVANLVSGTASLLKPVTTMGKAANVGAGTPDNYLSIKNLIGAVIPDGTNNAASPDGWSNMQSAEGYDDPAFVLSALRLYDEKYGTKNYESVTKLHGNIGVLNFKGEQGLKDRGEIIEKARQEVVKQRKVDE